MSFIFFHFMRINVVINIELIEIPHDSRYIKLENLTNLLNIRSNVVFCSHWSKQVDSRVLSRSCVHLLHNCR